GRLYKPLKDDLWQDKMRMNCNPRRGRKACRAYSSGGETIRSDGSARNARRRNSKLPPSQSSPGGIPGKEPEPGIEGMRCRGQSGVTIRATCVVASMRDVASRVKHWEGEYIDHESYQQGGSKAGRPNLQIWIDRGTRAVEAVHTESAMRNH